MSEVEESTISGRDQLLLSKRESLADVFGRGSATALLSTSLPSDSAMLLRKSQSQDVIDDDNNNNDDDDDDDNDDDDDADDNASDHASARKLPAVPDVTSSNVPSAHNSMTYMRDFTVPALPERALAVLQAAAPVPESPRRARSNSVPILPNFKVADDNDDYLEEDTVEAIWERFAPVGSRGTVRRVRPVVVRDLELYEHQLSVHKRHWALRVVVLALICIICFGDYINYDVPSSLIVDLKAALHLAPDDDAKIGVLYSVYTFPNIAVVLLGGYLIDRVGLRITAVLFTSLVVAGSTLMAMAEFFGIYWLAVVGRLTYGLGGESVYVCADAILCEYFDQAQLSIAMTLQAAFLNLGDLVTFSALPRISEAYGLSVALWFVAGVCACAFVAVIVWVIIDKLYEREVANEPSVAPPEPQEDPSGVPTVFAAPTPASHSSIVLKKKKPHAANEPTFLQRVSKRVRVFDIRFWSLAMTAASLTAATTTFSGFAPDLLEIRLGIDQTGASTIVSAISISNIVLTPILGVLFSFMRQVSIGLCVTFGMGIMMCAHLYLAVMPRDWPAWPPMAVIGGVYALLSSALWPTLPLVVRESRIGTAYGCLYALTNTVVSALYAVIGSLIHDNPGTVSLLWAGISFVGFVTSLVWNASMTRKTGLWAALSSVEALELEEPA
jgi:MFS family permease